MTCGSKWGVENNFLSVTLYNFPLPLRKPCVRGEPWRLGEGGGGGWGGRGAVVTAKKMHAQG